MRCRLLPGLLLVTAVICGPALAQQSEPAQSSARGPSPPGAAVVLDGETLYRVYDALGPFTAEERAKAAAARLRRIATDPFYDPDLFTVVEGNRQASVVYRGVVVGIISQADAARAGATPEQVASQITRIAGESIARYRQRRLPVARVRAMLVLAAATALLVVAFIVGRRGYRRLVARVLAQRDTALARLSERAAPGPPETIAAIEKTTAVKLKLVKAMRRAGVLGLVAVYLLVVFSAFPATTGYAVAALQYLLDPLLILRDGLIAHVPDLAFILVVVVLAWALLKAARWFLSEAAAGAVRLPGIAPEWAVLVYKIVRLAVIAVAAVMVYPYIPGSNTEAFKAIGLFGGALMTLGATGMAGNVVGGIALTFAGAFRVGDMVTIGGVTGVVVDTTILLTRIRTTKNEVVTVPNASVFSGQLTNYSAKARAEGLILHTTITIGYDAPWRKVHDLLIAAALRTDKVLKEPTPFVRQKSLNDYHISYEINAYTRDAADMFATYSRLHQNIHDAFDEGGIEILSPAYTNLRDGNADTIPAVAPVARAFRLQVETPAMPEEAQIGQ